MNWIKKLFRKRESSIIDSGSFNEWYLQYRSELAKAFSVEIAIELASWTLRKNHEKYFIKGISPKEAVLEYMQNQLQMQPDFEEMSKQTNSKKMNFEIDEETKKVLDRPVNPQQNVSHKRHIAKTISYRIVSTGVGFMIMWFVSGSVKVGAAFGVAELVYKPIQYYIHERIWYKYIKYGLGKK